MDAKDRRQLAPLIRYVLQQASSGTGPNPHYLSSYQILERLEEPSRSDLLKKYGPGGKGAGQTETGPRVIADVLKHDLGAEIDVRYMNSIGVAYKINGKLIDTGYQVIGLYKLRQPEDAIIG